MSKIANDNELIQQLAEEILILKHNEVMAYREITSKMNQLMKLIHPKLNYFIYKFFASQIDREDVLSNTLEKIFTKFHTYDPKYRFTTWIHSIAKNESLIYKQKNNVDTVDIDDYWGNLDNNSDIMSNSESDDAIDLSELAEIRFEMIHAGIFSGNLNYQMICEKELNGKTCHDIAMKYNTNENTVKTKIRAARMDMQKRITTDKPSLLEKLYINKTVDN